MRQLIKSDAASGDGVSIEREHPSTSFRSVPHFISFDVKPQFIDGVTGSFNALNETTNFRPTKRASAGIVHPDFKTGYDTDPVDSLSETFGDGDPRILGPISGEGVFKPQDINTRGSVIVGDNHFTTAGGGDSITGTEFGMRQTIGSTSGSGGSTFMTETFEPASGMNNFGDSTNPVLEIGANSGPGGTTFMTGQCEMLTDNVGNPYPSPID